MESFSIDWDNLGRTTVLDPAALAQIAARGSEKNALPEEHTVGTQSRLTHLNDAAAALDMANRAYWVEATNGIAMHKRVNRAAEVGMTEFDELLFSGTFIGYSKIVIGEIIGPTATSEVVALCMAFNESMLLPGMDYMPKDYLLHVPVLAVDNISQA